MKAESIHATNCKARKKLIRYVYLYTNINPFFFLHVGVAVTNSKVLGNHVLMILLFIYF